MGFHAAGKCAWIRNFEILLIGSVLIIKIVIVQFYFVETKNTIWYALQLDKNLWKTNIACELLDCVDWMGIVKLSIF